MKCYILLILTLLSLNSLAVDLTTLCSQESEKRILKIENKGELRFSDFKFTEEGLKISEVDFAEFGGTSRRGRRRHQVSSSPKPQMGYLLSTKVLAKDKSGWRSLNIRCGVNKGKLSTFTYEIMDSNLPKTAQSIEAKN